jgi:2,3-bisphosphoglycerate-dependent phosphoglycerate mutase
MKTKIYFVRHAQPDISTKDDMLRPLTEKGMEDTKRVTKALQGKNIEVIYSSPYKRSYDTVKDLADANNLEINLVEDFRERKVDNVWVEDFRAFSRRQWEDFNFKLESGECLREVQERNVAALYDVLKSNLGRNVVVGSHGTALSTVINYFNPDFGYDDFWAIADKMPYILCLKFDNMDFEGMEEVKL